MSSRYRDIFSAAVRRAASPGYHGPVEKNGEDVQKVGLRDIVESLNEFMNLKEAGVAFSLCEEEIGFVLTMKENGGEENMADLRFSIVCGTLDPLGRNLTSFSKVETNSLGSLVFGPPVEFDLSTFHGCDNAVAYLGNVYGQALVSERVKQEHAAAIPVTPAVR